MASATPENLQILLQVQEKDTQILAALHKIKELSERKEINDVQKELEKLKETISTKEFEVHENNRTQKKFEDEVATIEERTEKQKGKLFGGEVVAIKELQSLEADIESLKERQILIEDQIIEVMELNEPIQNEILDLEEQLARHEETLVKLTKTLQEAIQNIETSIDQITSEKKNLVEGVPNEILEGYESLRSRSGHVGIAKLVNRTCNGCNLDLPAVEVDRIKKLPEDIIINCEECGCILVR